MRSALQKRSIEKRGSNNRVKFVIAIIFLMGGAVLFKLYYLQVISHGEYEALASGQHQTSGVLDPERGKIFIQDNPNGNAETGLFPIATNKNFALVYAIPRDAGNAGVLAEKLYSALDQAGVEDEADKLINEQLKKGELPDEFKSIKKDAEIKTRKDKILEKYKAILSKGDDPYEPLEKKVDEDALKALYAALASDEKNTVSPADLEIKNNKIYSLTGEKREISIKGIAFEMESYRYYPENNTGSHLTGFLGYSDEKKVGRYGLEGFFNEELSGVSGSIKAERSADGQLVIINDREYVKPQNGSDLILTINRSIEFQACKKLREGVEKYSAEGGSVIVLEPYTGAIIAMCSWPDYNPNNYAAEKNLNVFNNPAIFDEYEPGSIFKPITMAAAIDKGKVTPDTTYNDKGAVMIEGWPKPIRNSDYETRGGHGTVSMATVLIESLNTGAIFAMQQIGPEAFAEYVKNFGFGEKTGIEMETESSGNIINLTKNKIRPIEAATATFGQGITVTPLQMVSAFAAIANGGILMKPFIVKEIVHNDGAKEEIKPQEIRRVISERTSLLLSALLVNVVDQGHTKKAGVKGYYVAGKTGTAQVANADKKGYSDYTDHSLIGFAPANNPKFVMLVKLSKPAARFAESTAAPLFKEIAEFILQYYQVPKER